MEYVLKLFGMNIDLDALEIYLNDYSEYTSFHISKEILILRINCNDVEYTTAIREYQSPNYILNLFYMLDGRNSIDGLVGTFLKDTLLIPINTDTGELLHERGITIYDLIKSFQIRK